jgi:hypothetical protein
MSWLRFVDEAPELAAAVEARLRSAKHHILATLRHDGSPRVSGTEVDFRDDGVLALGSGRAAMKAKDLVRDPRFALHAHPGDGTLDGGDAKLAGRAIDFEHDDGDHHLFGLELEEVVLTSLNATKDRLVVEWWRPGEGVKRVEQE